MYHVCPLFCHANPLFVLTETAANVGGPTQCSPIPKLKVWGLVRNHVMVRVNSGPTGNRRLTLTALCLSCFVKAANLAFVTADSSDKQKRKWRIVHDGRTIRSWGGGRAFPWGMGSSHDNLFCLHETTNPRQPGSMFICKPTFLLILEVKFLGLTSTPAVVFQDAPMKIKNKMT